MLLAAAMASPRAEEVDVELVLAVDVSSSVDAHEAALQRNGYVAAIIDREVISAISLGPYGRIAVLYVEYAGETFQEVVVDWHVIRSIETAHEFANAVARQPIRSAPSTSISGLIDFARHQLHSNEHRGLRLVIDISGDGPNSAGRPVREARDEAVAAGITINGLPILSSRPDPQGMSPSANVTRHYEDQVIGGTGAFALEVNEFESFAAAIAAKLVREIRGEPSVTRLEGGGAVAASGD
jgi:hypothetical protein